MQLSARVFKTKVIVFVRKAALVKNKHRLARWLMAPQLMGRAVRRKLEHRLRRAARRLEGGD